MGWTCSLKSEKEITISDIETILKDLPTKFWNPSGLFKPTEDCGWGWITCVDINKPDSTGFYISGSASMSGSMAEPVANYLKEKLEEMGHKIELEFNW